MKRASFALLVIACGSSQQSHLQLQVTSSDSSGMSDDAGAPHVTMTTGQTRLLVLVAVGANAPVTYAADHLPAFAVLDGPVLTISPVRADAGEYTLDVTAVSGPESQTVALKLSVQRENTAPTWSTTFWPDRGLMGDENGAHIWACPNAATCTIGGTPTLQLAACDAEGDRIVYEVEVVPRGQPFSRRSNTIITTSLPNHTGAVCGTAFVSMPGLVPEQSYDFAVRISDEFGAAAPPRDHTSNSDLGDGWTFHEGYFGFDKGPCTTKQCACEKSQPYAYCSRADDCCSGVCTANPGGPATCQ